jgi:hypothetical protein
MTSSLAVMVAYGYQIADDSDPLVNLVADATEIISKSTLPGALAVNSFPARKSHCAPHSHDLAKR